MGNMVFGVAGPGPAHQDNIGELLSDWLGYGTPDADGYLTREREGYDKIHLVLPLTDEHYTPGVAMVQAWSSRADLDYTGVIDAKTPPGRRAVKAAKGEATDLVAAADVTGQILDILGDSFDDGDEVFLLVLQEDQDGDEETAQLVRDAASLQIPVLNLSFGLAPVSLPPQAGDQEPPEVELVDVADVGYGQVAGSGLDLDTAMDGDPVATVFAVLDNLLMFHNAGDTMSRLYATGQASGQTSPLTADLLRVIFILQNLLYPSTGNPPSRPAPIEDPVNTERPTESLQAKSDRIRTEAELETGALDAQQVPGSVGAALGKTRREWFDKDTETWRPVGRGRPRKDVEFREVPVGA